MQAVAPARSHPDALHGMTWQYMAVYPDVGTDVVDAIFVERSCESAAMVGPGAKVQRGGGGGGGT